MAFSGDPIDLNTLHLRAGGTTQTSVSIDDTDILALRVSGSSTPYPLDDWYQTAQHTYTITNTTGGFNGNYGYYDGVTELDNISPDPASIGNIYTEWEFERLWWSVGNVLIMLLHEESGATNPAAQSNSGWEALKVNNTTVYRSDGSYSSAGGNMGWNWDSGDVLYDGSNPFVTNGDSTVKIG